MKKSKITWVEVLLLVPATAAICSAFNLPLSIGMTAGLTVVALTLALMDYANTDRSYKPTRGEWLIALSQVHRAHAAGKIDRMAALKGEMHILRALAIQSKVFGTVRRGVRVPAGWDMVEA